MLICKGSHHLQQELGGCFLDLMQNMDTSCEHVSMLLNHKNVSLDRLGFHFLNAIPLVWTWLVSKTSLI